MTVKSPRLFIALQSLVECLFKFCLHQSLSKSPFPMLTSIPSTVVFSIFIIITNSKSNKFKSCSAINLDNSLLKLNFQIKSIQIFVNHLLSVRTPLILPPKLQSLSVV